MTLAGGVHMAGRSPATLTHVTIANNNSTPSGSGIRVTAGASEVRLRGVVLSANTPQNCSGNVVTLGDNVSSDRSGLFSVVGNDVVGVDPQLGPLQDNGGRTLTHAISATSPATNRILLTASGECGTLTGADQRGRARPGKDTVLQCDSGAFERQVTLREPVGEGLLSPSQSSVAPRDPTEFKFSWIVPDATTWLSIRTLDLRFRDIGGIAFWVRWTESQNTFEVVHDDQTENQPATPGSARVLTGPLAKLHLRGTRVVGAGPTAPVVSLFLPIEFKEGARGRSFTVEAAATDDTGQEQGFGPIGEVTVRERAHP